MRKVGEFRKYLKRKGKKEHVVDDLIERCKVFEEFLHKRRKPGLDDADEEDLRAGSNMGFLLVPSIDRR